MQVKQVVEFMFSGCDYHTAFPEEIDVDKKFSRAFLKEAGNENPTDYQIYIFQDLLLEFAREIAKNMPTIEPIVRADVKRRRGFEEWSEEAKALRKQAILDSF